MNYSAHVRKSVWRAGVGCLHLKMFGTRLSCSACWSGALPPLVHRLVPRKGGPDGSCVVLFNFDIVIMRACAEGAPLRLFSSFDGGKEFFDGFLTRFWLCAR